MSYSSVQRRPGRPSRRRIHTLVPRKKTRKWRVLLNNEIQWRINTAEDPEVARGRYDDQTSRVRGSGPPTLAVHKQPKFFKKVNQLTEQCTTAVRTSSNTEWPRHCYGAESSTRPTATRNGHHFQCVTPARCCHLLAAARNSHFFFLN